MQTLFDSARVVKPRTFGQGLFRSLPTERTEVSQADRDWYVQDQALRDAAAQAQRHARRIAHEPDPSFVLRVKGRSYSVQPLHSPDVRCYSVTKADGMTYHVHEDEHGRGCTCPDFVWKRDGIEPEGCKHVRALVSAGCFA